MEAKDRIIVAIDVHDKKHLLELVDELKPYVGLFKFGLESLLTFGAPELHAMASERGIRIFPDPKLHDTPATISKAARQLVGSHVEFFSVHGLSGYKGMKAAVEQRGDAKVLAVTVLTTHSDDDAKEIFCLDSQAAVAKFARIAFQAGVDGLICSPHAVVAIRASSAFGRFILVTPGVRPDWWTDEDDDQSRVMTPGEAVKAGADYLVIGRPILYPPPEIGSPAEAAKRIAAEIEAALAP